MSNIRPRRRARVDFPDPAEPTIMIFFILSFLSSVVEIQVVEKEGGAILKGASRPPMSLSLPVIRAK